MARKYIYELKAWPRFTWNDKDIALQLSEVRLRQGLLLGKMRSYGFVSRWTATLKVLTEETVKSSAIEGVALDSENVRSSIARKLRLDVVGLKEHKDRHADGVVEMMLDATQKFSIPLTRERLFRWHADLFPGVRTSWMSDGPRYNLHRALAVVTPAANAKFVRRSSLRCSIG